MLYQSAWLSIITSTYFKCIYLRSYHYHFSYSNQILLSEALPELIQISGRKIKHCLNFQAFLFSQTDLLCQSLSLGLCSTIVLELHMQVQWYIWTISPHTSVKRTLEALLYHIWGSSDFFLAFLSPNSHPISFGIFQLLNLFDQDLVAFWVFFNFRNHNFIQEVYLPKLLIVAHFFLVFRIN